MPNVQRVLLLVIVCVVAIFISAILLPRYLSSQILEIRNELKSHDGNSKYGLQANLVPIAAKYTQDESKGFISSPNITVTEVFENTLANKSIQSPVKVKKRSKRQAISKDEHYTWNFHFNLSRHQNPLEETNKIASDTSRKNKLAVSIYTEGEGNGTQTSHDIQDTLGLVEYRLWQLFKHVENLTEEDAKNELAHSEKVKFDVSTLDAAESGDEPFIKRREGKILNLDWFSVFGFRKSNKKDIVSSTVSTMPETDLVFIKDNFVRTTQSPQTYLSTEYSQEVPNINVQAQSLVSEALSLVSNVSGSNLPGKTEDGECIGCDAINVELPLISTENIIKKDASDTVISPTEFSDGYLEMICKRLVNKVEESEHLSNTEEVIIEPEKINLNGPILKSSENSGFESLSSSVSEKKLDIDFVTESFIVSSSASENELKQKKSLNLGNLLAVFGSGRLASDQDESNELTSEVFADINLEKLPTLLDCKDYFMKTNAKMFAKPHLVDLLSDPKIQIEDFANATISSEHLEQPLTDLQKTILEKRVETFGKNSDSAGTKSVTEETYDNRESTINEVLKEILVHTEPNDLRSTILIPSTDIKVESATELQRDGKFLTIFGFGSGNGESRSLGDESFDADSNEKGSGEIRSLDVSGFSTDGNKLMNEDSRFLEDVVSDIDKNKFGSGDSISFLTFSGSDGDELGSGDSRTSFRIEIKEFGSGDSRSLKAERSDFESGESKLFGNEAFDIDKNELGSGDSRSLESDSDTGKTELGSGDSRSVEFPDFGTDKTEFGSGDSRSLESDFSIGKDEFGSGDSFKETFTDLNGDSLPNKERFFGLFGLTGSGDGRDLSRNLEVSHIEKKCQSNCTEQSHDCDTGCDYGNYNGNAVNSLDHNLENKGCHENCFDNASVDTSNEHGKIEANITNLEQTFIDNVTVESFQKSSSSNEHYEDVSFSSNLLKNESEILNESLQKCHDCNLEDLRELNKSTTEKNEFSKCDGCTECNSSECNSGILPTSGESKPIFVTGEMIAIDSIERRVNEGPETRSSTTRGDVGDDYTDEGSIDSSKAHNVIESQHEKSTENIKRFFEPVFLTGSGDGGLFVDSGGVINLLEEVVNTNVDARGDHPDEKNVSFSTENIIEKLIDEHNTERNVQRFLKPVFLTGSGDGGLFEDSKGPINLVQEEEKKTQNVSLRQSRLDNIPLNFSEVFPENSLNQSKQVHPVDGNTATEKFTSPVTPLRKRGRVDDTFDELCDDCDYDYANFIENLKKNKNTDFSNEDNSNFEKGIKTQSNTKIPIMNDKNNTATVSFGVNRRDGQIFGAITKEFKLNPCTAARECNITLNERCIAMNSSRVCGCRRGYARNQETRKCIIKKVVETSIKLPAENFEDDLKNPFSQSFQEKKKSSVEMGRLLLQNDPELLRLLAEIEIVKFSSGSLVVTLNLVFAAENKSEAQLVKDVENDIQIALRDERLMNSSSLDISGASLLSVNGEIDYCKSSELNYCSEHANCVSNAAIPGSYACHCKEHYRDVSFDPRRMGESCLAKCPQEYCGPYGHCEPLPNDQRLCLCSGLYFGRRCEVPGLYVLIVLGFVGFVSITMLLLVVFKRRCSRFGDRTLQTHGSEEVEAHSHMNGRVSDAIALEENIGTRFANISTPLPAITITQPSVPTESASSYDFDSTFDSSQSVHKAEENSAV